MKIPAISAFVIAAAAVLFGCDQSSNPSNAATQTKQLVYTVDSVILERASPGSAALVVKASGSVRSSGWSNPELQTDTAHSTGDTLIYKFVAEPPPKDKIVTQAEQPIEATLRVDNPPPGVKTIRIVSETNRTDSALAQDSQQPGQPPAAQPAPGQTPPAPAPFAATDKKVQPAGVLPQ